MNINYEGLVCYLNSNKNSKQNNVWLDSSGNNNNATLTSFSDNDFNGSYVQFNGNNYAVIPRCIQDDFTLSAEVILESSTSTAEPWQLWYNYASLIDAETSCVRNDFGLTISKDGHAYLGIGNPDRTIPYAQKSLFNEKHIITCTRKKDTGEYAMYIDGILIKKEIHPNKNSLTYPSEIYVGKGINNRFLSMKLFSIRIYNRVLDNFEIKQDSFFVKNKVYVNENNLPIIVDKLTDAKNIKISNNKYGNRVQTVVDKIVEKADDVTKAIKQEVINDSYSFKVGTGDVDVSADVEDGFGEVGIKGVTYQNLAPKGVALCDDASKFTHNYLHVTVTQQNGFVQCVTNQEGYCVLGYDNRHYNNLIQPNKCYITLAEVEIIKDTSNEGIYVAIPSYISYKEKKLQGEITKGVIAKAFKTNSDVTTNNNGWLAIRLTNNSTSVGDGFKCYYVSLFEISEAEFNNLSIDELIERYNYKCEGIVGVGDKSKNLFNKKTITKNYYINSNGGLTQSAEAYYSDFIKIDSNTTYTMGKVSIKRIALYDGNKNFITRFDSAQGNSLVVNSSNAKFIRISGSISELELTQFEKGSTATEYEPYYDGHKIEILSNGKNLFDYSKKIDGYYWSSEGTSTVHPNSFLSEKYIKVSNGEVYATNGNTQVLEYNVNKEFIQRVQVTQTKYNVPSNVSYIRVSYYNHGLNFEAKFEKDVISAEFEYSKEDKTQILLDEPLMRLDTSKDEITRDGKLIKRLCLTEVDGTEEWSRFYPHTIEEESIVFVTRLNKDSYINCVQDYRLKSTFAPTNETNTIFSKEAVQIYDSKLRVKLLKSRLTSLDVVGFKKWLSSNPIQILYLLKEPIIIDIVPPTLRIFKDGHLTFNTLVAPESNHVVQLNKSAQIERSIREVQSLDSRVGKLESFYDDMMLETSHKLSLLNYDFEYTRERNGE